MSLIELFLTGLSLSMDAFAVSICKGLTNNKSKLKKGLIISLSFGFFQALMPLLGYFLGDILSEQIIKYDHYIALILLSIIGISMIKESIIKEEYDQSINFKEIIILSIATSIDSLVVGITLSFLKVNITTSTLTIGLINFIMCFIGYFIGNIVGNKLNKYSKIFGGITLIIIGIKIFIEHIT